MKSFLNFAFLLLIFQSFHSSAQLQYQSAASYGLRKVIPSYNGKAIQVRRSTDNTVQDIGFTPNGDLDTTGLKDFVTNNGLVLSANGFISIWYDQSNNGLNLSPIGGFASEPQIVSAGSVIRLNSTNNWPAIQGNNANRTNLTTTFATAYTGSVLTVNSVINIDENSSQNRRVWSVGNTLLNSGDWNNTSYANINQRNSNNLIFERNSTAPNTTFAVGTPFVLSGRFNGGNRQLFNNGNASATFNDANLFNFNSMRLLQSINPAFENVEALAGKMSEFSMHYASLNTTRRTLIESSQAAYYNIAILNNKYTPPTPTSYIHFVNGVGRESATDSVTSTRQSVGMGILINTTASDFLKDNGDYLTIGINLPIFFTTGFSTSDLPISVVERWTNDWYLNKTDIGNNNGTVTIYFDFSDYGMTINPGVASNYRLISRNTNSGDYSVVNGTTVSVSGDRVLFSLDASNLSNNAYYTIGTTNRFSSTLPVEFVSFNAQCTQNSINLKWSTASESNNDFFTVERSIDGINFNAIAIVDGAGNSNQLINYSYTDSVSNKFYYRIKQTDFDGKFKNSNIVFIDCSNSLKQKLIAYPNPGRDKLVLEREKATNEQTKFEIIDLKGQTIYRGVLNKRLVIQTTNFASGIYLIKLENGESYKWVKQ